jgi:drug/metabolite transporter (DMT)-like permease
MVVLISAVLLKAPLRRSTVVALALSYGGLALCFASEISFGEPRALWTGGSLVFAAAVSYAFFIVGAARVAPRVGMHRLTALGMIASAVFFGGQALWIEGREMLHLAPSVYGWAVLMALLSTVLPVLLFGTGLRILGASGLSVASLAGPVAVLPLAAWMLGEPAGPAQWGGFALTLAGGAVLARGRG